MSRCTMPCPAVRGLVCDRHHGHRDQHAVRVVLPDGREVRIEWTVYDNTCPPQPRPLET